MSRIKDLKNNPDSTFNIIELLMTLVPVKKSKYADLVYTLIKNKCEIGEDYFTRIRSELMTVYNIPIEYFDGMTPYHLVILSKIATSIISPPEWKTIGKFSEFNERGLIEENDISKYKSMSEIEKSVKSAQLKIDMKEMEKYVKKIYEDKDGWIVIRPLTYQSALKYGYGTKWCTSSDSTTVQFEDYSKRGILIYSLNTKTGHKIACFKDLRTNGEFSFWNQIDTRVDSMESNLPSHIIEAIRIEIADSPVSNATMKRNIETKGVSLLPNTAKKMSELALKLAEKRRINQLDDQRPESEDLYPLRVEVESELTRFMNRNIYDNLPELVEEERITMSIDPVPPTVPDDPEEPLDPDTGTVERGVLPERVQLDVASVQLDEHGLPRSSDTYLAELEKIRIEE
jgi:hypothetical protein